MRQRTSKHGITTFQVLYRDGGKQRSKTFDTARAAQTFSDTIRVLGVKRAVAELEANPVGLTLDQLAEKFWEFKAGRVRSDRTIVDYKRDYENWIKRDLGWREAESIDETDVQKWVDGMRGKISAKSIGDRHAILFGIFKFGSSPTRRLIAPGFNPCVGTDLPKKIQKAPKGLRIAEWQALHAALTVINADAADLAEFMFASGWRWSEATALMSDEVEDDGEFVWVTVSQVARRQGDGSTKIVQDAKSAAGLRRSKLDPDISAVVRRRARAAGPGALVFTTTQGSMWNYGHFRSRFWAKAIAAAGLTRRPTIHWLRHSAVGVFDAAGASLAQSQRSIGHESITTTIDTYGGMIDTMSDETLRRIAEIRRTPPPIQSAERVAIED
jgi:site-specific recombinase XerD